MQVIITRPADDADLWMQQLQAAPDWQTGQWQARSWPLIEIQSMADGCSAQVACATADAVMFVSANAVRCSAFHPHQSPVVAAHTQAWAVGPTTVQALRLAGWPADRIVAPDGRDGATYDSEALWARLQPALDSQRLHQVLLVRGSEADAQGLPSGRDWLEHKLQQAGLQVTQVAVYQRSLPAWSPAQKLAARAALSDGSVWVISSSQAARHLLQLLSIRSEPGAPDEASADILGAACVIATHPRIAQVLQAQGWGRVLVSRSEPPALAASIKSMSYAR